MSRNSPMKNSGKNRNPNGNPYPGPYPGPTTTSRTWPLWISPWLYPAWYAPTPIATPARITSRATPTPNHRRITTSFLRHSSVSCLSPPMLPPRCECTVNAARRSRGDGYGIEPAEPPAAGAEAFTRAMCSAIIAFPRLSRSRTTRSWSVAYPSYSLDAVQEGGDRARAEVGRLGQLPRRHRAAPFEDVHAPVVRPVDPHGVGHELVERVREVLVLADGHVELLDHRLARFV